METNDRKFYLLVCVIVSLIFFVGLTASSIMNPDRYMAIATVVVGAIFFISLIAWIISYLHELDARLTEQEKR